MIYNNLGSTKIKVSSIGFGSWQLGGEMNLGGLPLSYGKIDEKKGREAIQYAIENGVNFFDTADIYGMGKSERILGEELKDKRDKVIFCTKVGNVPDGLNGIMNDSSYEHIIASCNRSLSRLQTDYIDIYLLHFIPERNQIKEATDAFKELVKQGKIKEYGISVAMGVDKIPELSEHFNIFEGYYNLLIRNLESHFELIKEKGLGFIAASPLSRGILSGKDYQSHKFHNDDIRKNWQSSQKEWYDNQEKKVEKFRELSKRWNIPLKNLAISYLLSTGLVSSTIPGIKTKEELEELLQSIEYLPLDKEKLNEINKIST